ncbi:MAG: hypothetical protein WC851_00100 [Candidatus Shapirobacteria bacterium]
MLDCMRAEDRMEALRIAEGQRLNMLRHTSEVVARSKQDINNQKQVDIWAMDKHTREMYIAENLEVFF